MGIHVKTDTGLVSMQAHVKTATGLVPMSLHVKTATGIVALSGGASAPIDADGPVFTSGATATPIAENSGAGQVVYTAAATDASLPVTYSLKPVGDYAAFSINSSTGAVTLTANPDYESKSSYSFTVIATDAASNASEQAVTLAITDVDEPVLLSPPSGFNWSPTVNVYKSGGSYYTDYDPTPFLVEGDPGVTTYYVDGQTGNDSNPGTAIAPKKSLVTISGGRVSKLLIKARGIFYGGITGPVQTGHDELCVQAWDGAECVITTEGTGITTLVWTDETGGVWSAPSTWAGSNMIDPYYGTVIDDLQKYPLVASLELCQSTPGSYYRQTSPSIKHYVHTTSGSSPDIGHTIFAANTYAQAFTASSKSYDQRIAFHGIDFRGGNAAFTVSGNSAYLKRVDLVGCSFKHGASFGAMHATGTTKIITYGCTSGPTSFDGFAYHSADYGVTPPPSAIEINNHGRHCGAVSSANQGSTTHYGGKVLRVNCTYEHNSDDQVADVGEQSQSWNVGCHFGPKGIGSGSAGVQIGNDAADTRAWLDGCTFSGLDYDVSTAQGGKIYYRNMPAPSVSPSSVGVVGTY